jgi:condensin complex subunit 2
MDVLIERTGNILLDVDDEEEEELVESRVGLKDRRLTKSQACRRRRRSSARFLQLSEDGRDNDNEKNNDAVHGSAYHGGGTHAPNDNLGEVYQNAIRMNAENRINASNSWNLTLIDHMDRFLMSSGRPSSAALEDTLGPVTGVNFTKASCTLDASVKIYSYRVDDVHLTSYKVLANLNRTDGSGTANANASTTANTADKHSKTSSASLSEGELSNDPRQERRAARNNTETLETNIGKQTYNLLLIVIHHAKAIISL